MSLLTRDGYVVDSDDFAHHDELTVTPEKSPLFNKDVQSFRVFEDRQDGTTIVPRYWGEKNFGPPKKIFGYVDKAPRLIFKGELRSDVQREAAAKSVDQLSCRGGGVLSLCTGSGKTVISLYVACFIGLKTLVVVHKQFLLDQWEERIRTFVPMARVGRLQRDIEDVEDCDIVVGMLQSIAMREYDDDLFSNFGLVIFDEVHVVPAPVFSRALLKLCAPHMLGLSATPVRKDGMSCVIHWFIGPTFMSYTLTGKTEVTVKTVNFTLNRTLPTNMAAATTIVCNMTERNNVIVKEVELLASAGYKIIVLSDRRAHCETLKLQLKKLSVEGALYLGGMKPFELEQSARKQVLLGTYHLAKEGLDIPTLDALILATPRSDVVQACGRILHGKTERTQVIVDVVDQWFIGRAQYNKRCTYYKSAGFTIIN